jgi:hypothetical protein
LERDIILDLLPDQLDTLEASPFIEIPTGASGELKEGDQTWLLVEAQANIGEKTPGVSYQVPLMVIEKGVNYGKVVDWYPGVQGKALGITARALSKFGKKDEVIQTVKGKVHLFIDRVAGAQAKARFVRQWSNPQEAGKSPILRAVLDSTQFLGVDENAPVTKELI